MSASAHPTTLRASLLPAGQVVALLACAALAGWGVLAGQPLLAVMPGIGLGAGLGILVGRLAVARAAADLVRALMTPGEAGRVIQDGNDAAQADGSAAALLPELRPLASAIQTLVARQQALFDVQAEQLEALRRQAHSDPLTGLANRRHFMAMLDNVLGTGQAPAEAGLLLLRMRDLHGLNQRIGHAATDHALLAVAGVLQTYPDRIGHCFAGRLNGADFALLLPVGGMAQETAAALTHAVRLPLLAIDAKARVFVGAVELNRPMGANQAMALADAALARAEADLSQLPGWPLGEAPPPDPALAQGESSWQRRMTRALAQGRVALAAYPVRTPDGRELHLDCPLRVQLQASGPMEPASRWLSLAIRSHLCAEADEKAVALALAAIDADGRARCINVAAQSVGSAEFVAAVARRLEQAPQAACRLWIDLPEALALDRPLLVRELSRRWRPLGAMLGLEHAGDGLARIPRLIDLGLDCVRIDGRFVHAISAEGADDARRHLQGLVKLVQAVGLLVTAEGVRQQADLDLLWQMGFDAATGPLLAGQPAVAEAKAPSADQATDHAPTRAPVTIG
ncbi:MAG: EAL domain-containing protein [Aquabacterium sp.]|nr:EAL domain-containing protein [Aquabacterium sp.]